MTEKKNYTPDQMEDAKKLDKALVSVHDEKRPFFALMVESMDLPPGQAARSGGGGLPQLGPGIRCGQ